MDISQLSDEEIKNLITNSEKMTELYTSIGDNEEKKFELVQKIDNFIINFIKNCKQKKFEDIKNDDKLFYETYLNKYLDENLKTYGTNAKVIELIEAIRSNSSSFEDIKVGQYFKKLYSDNRVYEKLTEKTKTCIDVLDDENFEDVDKIFDYFTKITVVNSKLFADVFSKYVDKLKDINLEKNYESLAINHILVKLSKLTPDKANKCCENLQKTFAKLIKICLDTNPNIFIESNTFSRLNQIRENEIFPENFRENIENIFSEKYSNQEVVGIRKYQSKWPKMTDKIKNFEAMEKDEFEDFISGIIEEKIITGKLLEEYCDYIINQKLIIKSPLNEKINDYFPVLKRAFEDKAIYILEKQGIKNCFAKVVSTTESNALPKRTDLGVHNQDRKHICFSEDYLKNLSLYNTKILGTLFHEIQHVKQKIAIESKDITSPIFYEMQKEQIIRNHIPNYYKDNYNLMQIEIDARIAGNVEKVKYLQTLGIADKLIAKIIDISANDKLREIENISKGKTKHINGKNEYVDVTFQKILKDNPNYIKEIPKLSIEFENDGTRKGNLQILMEYDRDSNLDSNSEKQYFDLVKYIIKNNSEISDFKMISDLKMLSTYAPSKQLEELRDDIIKESLLPWLDKIIERGTIECNNIFEFESMKDDFNKAIESLREFSINDEQSKLKDYVSDKLDKMPEIEVIFQDNQENNSFFINSTVAEKTELEAFEDIDLDVTEQDRIEVKSAMQYLFRNRKKSERSDVEREN